jgi:hypothetical protein
MSRRIAAVLLSAATVASLVVLYSLLREPAPARPEAPGTLAFHVSVPAANTATVRAEDFPVFKAVEGDSVRLLATSLQPGAIHVHGYDRQVRLQPGSEVILELQATATGYFPIHLHHADGVMEHVATLEVQR